MQGISITTQELSILKKWGKKSRTIFYLGDSFENKQSLISLYLA